MAIATRLMKRKSDGQYFAYGESYKDNPNFEIVDGNTATINNTPIDNASILKSMNNKDLKQYILDTFGLDVGSRVLNKDNLIDIINRLSLGKMVDFNAYIPKNKQALDITSTMDATDSQPETSILDTK